MQRPGFKKVRISPKYLKIIIISFSVLFVLLIIGGYIAYTKRQAILEREIAKAKAKAKTDYNLDLEIGDAHFTGLSTVEFSNITIVPAQRDSLLSIKNLEVGIRLTPLIL